jgi:hypothetical protein
MNYNYEYFSGANVMIKSGGRDILECAGISYSVSTSRQPVYGYNSEFFDVMLPGRVIVQGNLIVNYVKPNYLEELLYGAGSSNLNKYNGRSFNISVSFGEKNKKENLIDCYLISSGKTIQVTEQVILEEYGFVAKLIN